MRSARSSSPSAWATWWGADGPERIPLLKKRHDAEQIVAKLRQADVDLGKGMTVPEVCKHLGISEQTYYRWRTKYGGMD